MHPRHYLSSRGQRSVRLLALVLARLACLARCLASHMRSEFVVEALAAAERTRAGPATATTPTDYGAHSASRAFTERRWRARPPHRRPFGQRRPA